MRQTQGRPAVRSGAMTPTPKPPWSVGVVETLSGVLAATEWPGLTGPEIGTLLAQLGIEDPYPGITNRKRLAHALLNRQASDRSSHRLVTFVVRALDPARNISDPNRFVALQQGVNEVLSMVGLRVNDEGQMAWAKQARTLDEVAELAGRLRGELNRRGVHPEVTRYCEEELLRRSIFHAVFEATKGLSQRLRQMSGSVLDGSELVDACFAKQALSSGSTPTRPRARSVSRLASPTCSEGSPVPSATPRRTPREPSGWLVRPMHSTCSRCSRIYTVDSMERRSVTGCEAGRRSRRTRFD
jgi:hypothetical protein